MPVSSYGGSTDSLAAPSLSSWAASVSAALDGSDTTVNTRITQRVLPLTAKTGNYTLTASDEVVTCNGTLTITLPTAVGLTGKQFIIRNIATNTVTIARTSSQTVDGCSGTITLAGKGSMSVVSDGANWLVVSGQYADESVGRRIFTWSSALANGATTGWQMTYGDTGWREILTFDSSGTITNGSFHSNNHWAPRSGTAGYVRIRRRDGRLHFWIANCAGQLSSNLNATALTSLPTGFTWSSIDDQAPILTVPTAGGARKSSFIGGSYATNVIAVNQTNVLYDYIPSQQVSIVCDVAWPTSLPGTAVGSIPAS